MLSRIMRHPAGFMRKALGKNFLAGPFARPEPAAPRPDYWMSRFSGVGLSVTAKGAAHPAADGIAGQMVAAPAPDTASPEADRGGKAAGGALPRQGGKAASFLLADRKRVSHP